MAQITYDDKSAVNVNSNVPDINKVNASDMNMIKSVVNSNYDEFANQSFICCTLGSVQSLTATGEAVVKLNTTLASRGTGFTLTNNKITCNFDGYVEIAGQIQFSNATSTSTHNIYIYQNTNIITRALQTGYSNGGNKPLWCTPIIISVSYGDTFNLSCYGYSGEQLNSASNSTNLTIRRV